MDVDLFVDVSSAVSQISDWLTGSKPAIQASVESDWKNGYCGGQVLDECDATNLDSKVEDIELIELLHRQPAGKQTLWNVDYCMDDVEFCETMNLDSRL